jgi:hypothetical protein
VDRDESAKEEYSHKFSVEAGFMIIDSESIGAP